MLSRLFVSCVIGAAYVLFAEAKIVLPRGAAPRAAALPDGCTFQADIVQIVDVSWSENDNAGALMKDAQKILDYVASHEGWRTGMATFVDKPIEPLGWDRDSWRDWCFRMAAPLGADTQTVKKFVDTIYLAGGFDFPEAQLEALYRAVISQDLGWQDSAAQKVVVLATDAIAHMSGDAKQAAEESGITPVPGPNNLTPEDLKQYGANYGCSTVDYPSLEGLASLMKEKKIIPVFLAAPPTYSCDEGQCLFEEMNELAKTRGDPTYADPNQGLALYYTEMLKQMGIPGVVVPMGTGFQGIGDAFIQAMKDVGTLPDVCVETTTPAPTTTTGVSTVASDATLATTTASTAATTAPTTAATTTLTTAAPTALPTVTPTTPPCVGDECTLKVDMVIDKCNGQQVKQTLIV